MCCRGGLVFPADDGSHSAIFGSMHSVVAFNRDQHLDCDTPHYVYLGAILSLLSVAVFIRLAAVVKLAFLAVICVGYVLAVEVVDRVLFVQFDRHNPLRSVACPVLLHESTQCSPIAWNEIPLTIRNSLCLNS